VIRYNLVCDRAHDFESWFQNSAAFDRQAKRGLVTCPVCDSAKVEKALMTPQLTRSRKGRAAAGDQPTESATSAAVDTPAAPETPASASPVALMSAEEREFRSKLKDLRAHLTKNADYVGPQFSEQARQMHYGEIEHRSIYGEASADEAKSLHEEGIAFHPLPVLPDERN
jgi:hypothetical protein